MPLSAADKRLLRRVVREEIQAVVAEMRAVLHEVIVEDTQLQVLHSFTRHHASQVQ